MNSSPLMRRRLRRLSAQRVRLSTLAQAERTALSVHLEPTDALAEVIGLARRCVNMVARHPVLVGLAGTAFAVLKPRRAARWAARAWSVWRIVQAVRRHAPRRAAAPA